MQDLCHEQFIYIYIYISTYIYTSPLKESFKRNLTINHMMLGAGRSISSAMPEQSWMPSGLAQEAAEICVYK